MRNSIFIFFLGWATLIAGCSSGAISIEKSEGFQMRKKDLKSATIHYFEPDFEYYEAIDIPRKAFIESEKLKVFARNQMMKSAKKNRIKAVFLSDEKEISESAAWLEEFLPLHDEIRQITGLQDNPINNGALRHGGKNLQQKIFTYPPRLFPEHAHLASKLKSPYVGLCGIFAVNANPKSREAKDFVRNHRQLKEGKYFIFYHIIVNLEYAEIEYSEFKLAPVLPRPKFLEPIVYDSFFMLNQNLKK